MLAALIEALRTAIDLVHKKDENRKLQADIALAEKTLADAERKLVSATPEDILRYDERARRVAEAAAYERRCGAGAVVGLIPLLPVGIFMGTAVGTLVGWSLGAKAGDSRAMLVIADAIKTALEDESSGVVAPSSP